MAKFPSRKLSGTKKIASRGFSKAKVKIPSRGFAKGDSKIASRKIAKPSAVAEEKLSSPTLLDRPTDEKALQVRLSSLKGKLKLKPASDLENGGDHSITPAAPSP